MVEAAADEQGWLTIHLPPGLGLERRGAILEPLHHIFSPGFKPKRLVTVPPGGGLYVDPTIIPMRRLRTREERLKELDMANPVTVPEEYKRNLSRLISVERQNLGFQP